MVSMTADNGAKRSSLSGTLVANVTRGNLRRSDGVKRPQEGLIVFTLLSFFMVAQFGLVRWKKSSPRLYNEVTLLGLWTIPIAVAVFVNAWVFVVNWSVFSAANGYYVRLALQPKLDKETPYRVYQWFDRVHRLCYTVWVFAYTLLALHVLGSKHLVHSSIAMPLAHFGFYVMFYAVYFGVLGRDLADACAERMSNTLGYVRCEQPPPNLCALCGEELHPSEVLTPSAKSLGVAVRLNCSHEFHEYCIRGWTIVGKKDTCPFCGEKVSVNAAASSKWNGSKLWLQVLDIARYLIVWNPLLLVAFNALMYVVGDWLV